MARFVYDVNYNVTHRIADTNTINNDHTIFLYNNWGQIHIYAQSILILLQRKKKFYSQPVTFSMFRLNTISKETNSTQRRHRFTKCV